MDVNNLEDKVRSAEAKVESTVDQVAQKTGVASKVVWIGLAVVVAVVVYFFLRH
jgi:hypothetical protein